MNLIYSISTILAIGARIITADQTPILGYNALHTGDDRQQFTTFQSQHDPDYSIRVQKQNATICDVSVDQYTGWLDIGPKHLFFWYFESASDPATDPLLLWLNGGPGGSSLLGLLMELGPCLVNKHGDGTTANKYGWNKNANLLFVDQPADVGFSYLDKHEPVTGTSFQAAEDMHKFLQLFTTQVFPALQNRPLHISGESYGGHYLPTLGSQIVSQNQLYPARPTVNLTSVLIGNGFVSPLDTAYGYWETLCTTKPGLKEPIFNSTICDTMATNLPRCTDLARVCYEHPDPAICSAAETVCWHGVIKFYDGDAKRNRFDITIPCDVEEICYVEAIAIDKYLNSEDVRSALGVPKGRKYHMFSDKVARAFEATNDLGISMEQQLLYLLDNEIDVLLYQGMLDLACNTAGNLRWANGFAWKGGPEFASKDLQKWDAGKFKEVKIKTGDNKKTTRFSFVTVEGAGHMVPYDKPAAALDMLSIWLSKGNYE